MMFNSQLIRRTRREQSHSLSTLRTSSRHLLRTIGFCALLLFASVAYSSVPEKNAAAKANIVRLEFEPAPSMPFSDGALILRGSDARRQILVTGYLASGETCDATHRVEYK